LALELLAVSFLNLLFLHGFSFFTLSFRVRKIRGGSQIWSRNHLPLEPKFPTIHETINQLNLHSTILGW
jgi:hypothetical protein